MNNEAAFTKPHEQCARPDYWTAPDCDSAEHEVSLLVGAFVRALQPEFVVETGTAYGWTAVRVAEALRLNGHGKLATLEVDHGRAVRAKRLLCGYSECAEVVEQSSLEYEPPMTIDFAWFDSLPLFRCLEFLRFYEFFRPGAIVGFHDTATPAAGGAGAAVRGDVELLEARGFLRPIFLRTPRGVAFAEVFGGGRN